MKNFYDFVALLLNLRNSLFLIQIIQIVIITKRFKLMLLDDSVNKILGIQSCILRLITKAHTRAHKLFGKYATINH